jgi:hypothetical protein
MGRYDGVDDGDEEVRMLGILSVGHGRSFVFQR